MYIQQKLRPYQVSNIDEIVSTFKTNKSILYVAPPGSGKTRIFTRVSQILNKPTLVLVHRTELLDQTKRVLAENGLDADVRTVQGVASGSHQKYGLVVIDEVHHYVDTWKDLASLFVDADTKILGATATPLRLDGIYMGSLFEKVINGPQIEELQKNNWLANFTIITPSWIQKPNLPIILNGKIVGWCRKPNYELEFLGEPVEIYRKYANNQPALIFVRSLAEINRVVDEFNRSGITATGISYISKNRDEILNDFKSRQIRVLVSCEVLNDGVDLPFVKFIILLRKTESFTLWLQILGRSFRPYNNEKATIIDAVGNAVEFGLNPMPGEVILSKSGDNEYC